LFPAASTDHNQRAGDHYCGEWLPVRQGPEPLGQRLVVRAVVEWRPDANVQGIPDVVRARRRTLYCLCMRYFTSAQNVAAFSNVLGIPTSPTMKTNNDVSPFRQCLLQANIMTITAIDF
jgi:hypothetical protein